MLPRKICALAPALVLTLGFGSNTTFADPPGHHGRNHVAGQTAIHARFAAKHRHLVRHDLGPHRPYAGRAYPAVPPGYAGPGYVFVPGQGILGEDCDMPTSTCPNEQRDVQ